MQVILLGNNPPREIVDSSDDEEAKKYWIKQIGENLSLKVVTPKFKNSLIPINALYMKKYDDLDKEKINNEFIEKYKQIGLETNGHSFYLNMEEEEEFKGGISFLLLFCADEDLVVDHPFLMV